MAFKSTHKPRRSPEMPSAFVPVQADPREETLALLRNKPPSVRAIPSAGTVSGVAVEWRNPTRKEMLDGVTEVAMVTTAASGKHAGKRRIVLEQTFRPDVDDAEEFGLLGQGIAFLRSLGSLTEGHVSDIETALQSPPPTIKTRLDTAAELSAFQATRRPLQRHDHSLGAAYRNFVVPSVRKGRETIGTKVKKY